MKNGKNPTPTERQVTLSDIESELVKAAVAENQKAQQTADSVLASRLQPIRAAHKLAEGVRADFRPTKDGKSIVMVVFDEKAAK
jgi:hypothetical protein